MQLLLPISENYAALWDTRCLTKQQSNDSKRCAHIDGVPKEIESIDFFFGLELGYLVLNMADNLSAAIQGLTVSANEGQHLMCCRDQKTLLPSF